MSAHLTSPRRALACGALALTLVLSAAACSDDDDGRIVADVLEDDGLPTQPAAAETTTTLPQVCEPETPAEVSAEDKPVIEAPGGEDPTELGIEDLTEGEGRAVEAGDSVEVQYSGVLFADGTEFDTSWDDLMTLPVTVGTGQVIPGFDEGLVGMKPGGRRQLTIPADQAYGEAGSGENIPPNSALIFVIDLVQVCYPDPEAAATEGEGEGDESTTTAAEGEAPDTETTAPPAEGEGAGDESTTTAAEAEGGDDTTTTAAG